MASYSFSDVPIPSNLPVFNRSIYRDIDNRGAMGFQGNIGNGFQGINGVQGFQGNQGIRGNQGVQGVQGLASPISVNNFVSGIQGLQSSFIYSGAQTIQTQFLNASSTTNIQSGAFVVSNGRVGLSTTTPSYTLDVLNTGQSSTNMARFNTSVSAGTYVSWTQPEGISLFRFGTSNLLRMVAGTQSSSSIEFNSTSVRDGSIDYKHDTLPTTNRYMSFTTNQTERARIDSNGLLSYSGVQGQQGYFDRTLYAKDNFGVGFQGTQGSFGFVGCQTIQGQQGYLSSSLQCKDIYGVGFQGVQGSFGFVGCQTIQGQQGYLSSSSYAKDNYGVGFQGVQGSFGFVGCQSLQAQSIKINSNFVPVVPNSNIQFRYGTSSASTISSTIISYGYTFSSIPFVFVQLDDAIPQGSIPAIQTQSVGTTQFSVILNSITTGLGTLRWLAIGEGN